MTLMIPVREETLSCISDGEDDDSGCLARSPDDILRNDFSDKCFADKMDLSSVPRSQEDGTSKTSLEETRTETISIQNDDGVKLGSEISDSQNSINVDEGVSISFPLVIYESKITVNSLSKFSPPKFQSINHSDDSIPSSLNEYEKANSIEELEINQSELPVKETCEDVPNLLTGNDTGEAYVSKDTEIEEKSNNNICDSQNTSKGCEELIAPISNFAKFQKIVNFSTVNIKNNNFSSASHEDRKIKLRKLMQRRSVSESSSNSAELMCHKKIREKLRHSFSSYENCDKLHNILDINLKNNNNKDSLCENEKLNNNINQFLNCENDDKNIENINGTYIASNNSLLESRASCFEIPDALVNNAKISMIEEYKKLKKNSSLAYQNTIDHSSNMYSEIDLSKLNQNDLDGYSQNSSEAFENVNVSAKDLKDQLTISQYGSNDIPAQDLQVTVKSRDLSRFNSINVEKESDFHAANSPPMTNSNVNSFENNSNIKHDSSPPTRLELWKSILAEKRNSIKNHIKGICKYNENEVNFNNNICSEKNNDSIEAAEQSLKFENQINSNDIKEREVIVYSDSPLFKSSSDTANENDSSSIRTMESSITLKGKTDIVACDNFVCINSLHIIPCTHELQNFPKNVNKNKLEEACQGIVFALDSLPEGHNSLENFSPKKFNSVNLNNRNKNTELGQGLSQISEIHTNKFFSGEDQISKVVNCGTSNIASIITTIQPPIYSEITNNEKSQQCPTPPPMHYCNDNNIDNRKVDEDSSSSSANESDYCQTDVCGDDCDYCSGDEAEDEEEDTCDVCRRNYSASPICKHTRVITNGSLRSLRKQSFLEETGKQNLLTSRSLALQAALRRRHINHQELSAIREYSVTSDEQQDSEDDVSHDGSICDISSSWRFGLCDDQFPISAASTLKNESCKDISFIEPVQISKLKSNSLPASSRTQSEVELLRRPGSAIFKQTLNIDDVGSFNVASGGVRLPPRPPRLKRIRHPLLSISPPVNSISVFSSQSNSLRPTMGLQGLQQRPSISKLANSIGMSTGPKTLAPRSPLNPNPPYGFPNPPSPPIGSPGSPFQGRKSPLEATPPSPRTNSRSGALVTRNFSISDDEGGQRLSRRQVTITRHESAYRVAADKGYLLPHSSPIDPYWLTWKLGVLLKTVEEVGSRLEESEKIVSTWGPLPQDQNLADQYVHNIRKFRETLPDLQRGVDDVNDQAARFSAHNVPLTPANSAALHDLNNRWKNLETTVNDRWRQVAGRSREVTPLTPAQLASSVIPPWERATATNKVPYYINHAQETTHWDHPQMMDLLDSLSEFNHIKFSAYRTATKLRSLQKKLSLDRAKLQMVTDVFDEHGLRGQNDRLIDVNDMIVVLSTLYGRISSDNNDVNTTIATDLCLNWLLNVYDSQRTGQMRVLSFRVGLICLCRGHLEEKYRYMFRLIADPNRLVDQRKLGLLLHDCVQVPRQLGEVAAFGGSNIEPSVRSCFTKAGKDRETIEAVHFLTWVQQEPQSLVWLAVLHRVAASENVQHQVKCNICKTYPIVGLRYRCLKCLSFDMCQRCFFEGRSSKSHKITHPMHEYCTATTAGDEMKDFTKALKNKFKSKRSLQKHTKKGYLPVQTVLEGDPIESPSPSPSHNVSSQDMHSRLELYASRLAEVELRTNSNSTPDSEDEHGLIAQYCQSLSSTDAPFPVPKSPLQIMASADADQKDELEQMIKDLEEENRALQAEYERLKSEQPTGSIAEEGIGQRSEAEMMAEAKLLREHKGRLEARMSILEDHNRQLEAQLQRLRQLLVEQQSGMGSPNKSGTLQTKSVTASQLAMDSPAKINGHSTQGDLEKPVGSQGASMNREKGNDSHSDDHSDENDYDNTVSPIQAKSD